MGRVRGLRVWRLDRAGELRMEPGTLATRAKAFQASIGARSFVTMVVQRTEVGLTSFVIAPDTAQAVTTVAHLTAVTASTAADYPLDGVDLSVPAVAELRFAGGRVALRDTQVGADLAGLAQMIGRALAPGSWVAVTVRSPSRVEHERWMRWLRHRMQVATPHHHSAESNAVVMTVHAGGASRGEAASLLDQVAAAMPGFDLPVRAHSPSPALATVWGVAAAMVAAVAGYWIPWPVAAVAAITAVVAGLVAAGSRRGRGSGDKVLGRVARRPSARLVPPRAPNQRTRDDGSTEVHDGDYPLATDAFLVGAHLPVGLVAPHSGALTGASQTATRPVPPGLRTRVGPRIGRGADGSDVYLSAEDMFAGTLLLGQAGSGKSVAVRQLFAWHLLERAQPSGVAGAPGRDCALVVIESKREGALQYLEWDAQYGSQALVVDVMDPASYAIDLVPPGADLLARATGLVEQMRYAFGDDAIGYRSRDTLIALAMGALVVDDTIAELAGLEPRQGPLYYMAVLVEAFGEAEQSALYGSIASQAVRVGAPGDDLSTAHQYLKGFFDGLTTSQRRQLTDAPRSKIKPLVSLGSWWSTDRPRVSWSQILSHRGVVVINVGASLNGRVLADDELMRQLQAMMMFSLRATIKAECDGWQALGRSVAIFSDELSLLAGNSGEVVSWLRDQGRSYGVRPVFALQYPEQLDQKVRASVLGFSALLALKQSSRATALELAADFAADGTEWDAADVVNLANYTAIARLSVGQMRQPAFTVQLTDWESGDGRARFAAAQGYDL